MFLWDNGITTKPNTSLTEGWHSVTITHTNGCVVVDSVLIPNSAPVIDSMITINVACNGGQAGEVELISMALPVSYTWQHGAVSEYLDSLSAGIYFVMAEDSRPCIDSMTIIVSESDSISNIITVNDVNCYGNNDGQATISTSGGLGPHNYFIDSAMINSNTIDSLSIGTYLLYSIDSLGCISETDSFTIVQPDVLSVGLTSTLSSGLNVPDGSANALVSGGTVPYSYIWNDPLMQSSSTATNLLVVGIK